MESATDGAFGFAAKFFLSFTSSLSSLVDVVVDVSLVDTGVGNRVVHSGLSPSVCRAKSLFAGRKHHTSSGYKRPPPDRLITGATVGLNLFIPNLEGN